MDKYSVYLPIDRLYSFVQGSPLPDRCQGTALFADISGFTPLTEALVRKFGSQRGAEELTRYLNLVYDALISQLHHYGGSVISFAGDAITCWFDQDDGVRAASCALGMQEEMEQFASIQIGSAQMQSSSTSGTGPLSVSLAVKIALATGTARRFIVGDPAIQLVDVLAGQTLYRLAEAEHFAERGEIILDSTTARSLEHKFKPGEWRTDQETGHKYVVLDQLTVSPHAHPFAELDKNAVPEDIVKSWLLPPIYKRLSQGQGEFIAELRPANVLFLSFTGIDFDLDPDAGLKLDQYFRFAQGVISHYDGYFFQLIVGDKGNYLYGALGAPTAHEDDAVRAVSAALELINPPPEQSSIQNVKIGISQGRLWTGAYGGTSRRTYGIIGDDVNLSARLMQAAQPGQILTNQSVKESADTSIRWETLPPIRVKGKTDPIDVFSPTGSQPRQTLRLQAVKYALPMVGRQEELERCRQTMIEAHQGNGQVLGLSGEAGVGKSRLLYEITLQAVTELQMLYSGGECQSHAVDSSYWVWQPIWRGLFDIDPNLPVEDQITSLEAKLNQIDPNLVARLPLLGTIFNIEIPDNDLTKTFDAQLRKSSLEALLVDCFRAVAREKSLFIVLEDCQWMDALSRDLVEVLGRSAASLPVMIILAYRPGESDRLKQAKINQLPNFTEISLHDFTPEESRELLDMKLVQSGFDLKNIPESLVRRILEQGQGNPFYIEELLNFIFDQSIDPTDIQTLASLELPTSLHSLILSRLDQLTDQQQITLKVASVIGRLFQAALLWGMYPELGQPDQVRANLEILNRMQLTSQDPGEQELTYFFKQIVTQQVAYENLPYATRAMLHGQLALFIEHNFQDSLHQFIDLLAFHFMRGENWSKAVQFNLQAAEEDLNKFANEASISACLNTLQAAANLPAEETLLERLKVHDMLGELYTITGQYDQALESYDTARQLAVNRPASPEKSRQQARFCRKTAEVYERRNEFERAFSWLHQGLDYIDPQNPNNEAARIYHLGAGIYYRQGNYPEAISWCQQGLETASRIHTQDGQLSIAHVYITLGAIHNRLGELHKAIEYCQQSIKSFEALSEYVGLARAYNNLGINYSDQGDWNQSSNAYDRSLEINEQIGDIQQIGLVSNNLGNIFLYRGNLSRAQELFLRSNATWKQLGAKLFDAVTLSNLAQVHIYQSDFQAARRALEQSEAMLIESGAEGFLPELERRWGEYYLFQKDLDPALQHIQKSIALAESQQDLLEGGKSYAVLGEILLDSKQLADARIALDESLKILAELNEYEAARTHLILARLALAQGDPGTARNELASAKPVFEQLGAQGDLAQVHVLEQQLH